MLGALCAIWELRFSCFCGRGLFTYEIMWVGFLITVTDPFVLSLGKYASQQGWLCLFLQRYRVPNNPALVASVWVWPTLLLGLGWLQSTGTGLVWCLFESVATLSRLTSTSVSGLFQLTVFIPKSGSEWILVIMSMINNDYIKNKDCLIV